MFVDNMAACGWSGNGLFAKLTDQQIKLHIDHQIEAGQVGMLNEVWTHDLMFSCWNVCIVVGSGLLLHGGVDESLLNYIQ